MNKKEQRELEELKQIIKDLKKGRKYVTIGKIIGWLIIITVLLGLITLIKFFLGVLI